MILVQSKRAQAANDGRSPVIILRAIAVCPAFLQLQQVLYHAILGVEGRFPDRKISHCIKYWGRIQAHLPPSRA